MLSFCLKRADTLYGQKFGHPHVVLFQTVASELEALTQGSTRKYWTA